jgi:hypothetical protein
MTAPAISGVGGGLRAELGDDGTHMQGHLRAGRRTCCAVDRGPLHRANGAASLTAEQGEGDRLTEFLVREAH